MAVRTAAVVWKGDLARGSGQVEMKSGALPSFPVTWASRSERSEGKTSPEELIAAAHASCFSMALAHGLTEAGTPPAVLNVGATCTFDLVEGVPTITSMALEVLGDVPALDLEGFREAARAAKEGCPVSRALKGNVEITLSARSV